MRVTVLYFAGLREKAGRAEAHEGRAFESCEDREL